jgi:hypothetical protein
MNLFKIQQNYLQLAEELINNMGEITPEIEVQLQINEAELRQKTASFAQLIQQMDYENEIIDSEMKRLKDLKDRRTKSIDRIKETIKHAMINCDVMEISSPTLKINFRASESTEIINEALIPERFIVTKEVRTIDKVGIKKAIKDGEEVPGALISHNSNLQIK